MACCGKWIIDPLTSRVPEGVSREWGLPSPEPTAPALCTGSEGSGLWVQASPAPNPPRSPQLQPTVGLCKPCKQPLAPSSNGNFFKATETNLWVQLRQVHRRSGRGKGSGRGWRPGRGGARRAERRSDKGVLLIWAPRERGRHRGHGHNSAPAIAEQEAGLGGAPHPPPSCRPSDHRVPRLSKLLPPPTPPAAVGCFPRCLPSSGLCLPPQVALREAVGLGRGTSHRLQGQILSLSSSAANSPMALARLCPSGPVSPFPK